MSGEAALVSHLVLAVRCLSLHEMCPWLQCPGSAHQLASSRTNKQQFIPWQCACVHTACLRNHRFCTGFHRDKMSKYYLWFAMCCLSFCFPWQLIQENCNDLQFCTAVTTFKEIEVKPSKLGVALKAKNLPWQSASVLWSAQVVIPSYLGARFQASYITTDKEPDSDTLPGLEWWFIQISPAAVPDWRAVFSHGWAAAVTSLTLPLTPLGGCAGWNCPTGAAGTALE